MSRATRIVIVNWNGAEFLPPCLESVLAQRAVEVEPVVIDNGSTDASLQVMAERFPQVPLVRHHNNYAAANNLGVREAKTERVMLLNTDATLDPDALAQLHDALDAAPQGRRVPCRASSARTDGSKPWGSEPIDGARFAWRDVGIGEDDPGPGPAREIYGLSGCAVLFDRAPGTRSAATTSASTCTTKTWT